MSARDEVVAAMAARIQQTPIYRDQDAYRDTDYRKLAAWALEAALETGLVVWAASHPVLVREEE